MAQIPTKIIRGKPIVIKGYKVNQALLTVSQKSGLFKLASQINNIIKSKFVVSLKITIEGHTDSIGTETYNNDLGFRRAKNAEFYLSKIINQSSNNKVYYSSISSGEKKPISSNATGKARFNNRRIELISEWNIIIQSQKTPKTPELPEKKTRKILPFKPVIKECADVVYWEIRFGKTEEALYNIYNSTSLHWERGYPIGLKVIDNKGFLSNFTKEIQDQLISEALLIGTIDASGILGAVLGFSKSLKAISDDVKNEKIMNSKDEAFRRNLHKKLVCALFTGEDLQTGSKWIKIYNMWEKLTMLRTLCAQKRGDPVREPQINIPPSWMKQSSSFFDENRRGIDDRGRNSRGFVKG